MAALVLFQDLWVIPTLECRGFVGGPGSVAGIVKGFM